jgi:hypothetical protein
MKKKKEILLECDVCGSKVEIDSDESWYGGHPFQGWYHLQVYGGSTRLEELRRKKEWDICSKKCLKKFVDSV